MKCSRCPEPVRSALDLRDASLNLPMRVKENVDALGLTDNSARAAAAHAIRQEATRIIARELNDELCTACATKIVQFKLVRNGGAPWTTIRR